MTRQIVYKQIVWCGIEINYIQQVYSCTLEDLYEQLHVKKKILTIHLCICVELYKEEQFNMK